MKTIEELRKTEEYQDLQERERRALETALEDLQNRTGKGLRVQVTSDRSFDMLGFWRAREQGE